MQRSCEKIIKSHLLRKELHDSNLYEMNTHKKSNIEEQIYYRSVESDLLFDQSHFHLGVLKHGGLEAVDLNEVLCHFQVTK